MTRLILLAVLFSTAAVAGSVSTKHDDFSETTRITGGLLARGGPKLIPYIGSTIRPVLVRSTTSEAFFFEAEIWSDEFSTVEASKSLLVKVDGSIYEFDASLIRPEISYLPSGKVPSNYLEYPVIPEFLEALLGAEEVQFRIEGSHYTATGEMKKKGRKKLREFLDAISEN